VVRQGLTLLELGHAVIELRQLIAASHAGAARDSLQPCCKLAAYLHAPGAAAQARAASHPRRRHRRARRLPDAHPEARACRR
jgi:hypothetical protein